MIKHMFNIRRMRTTLRLHNRSMERGFLFSIVSNKSIPCIRGTQECFPSLLCLHGLLHTEHISYPTNPYYIDYDDIQVCFKRLLEPV